ncbi:Transcription termination factor like [Quillaja saponaria]|uniref:Transcription termination factor like n=1 Tax=Quillaja saponaria TaxID=32244 RepID=A0AAD7QIG4_QUISA|nr:Transcription termination factor like [Quillaja saponaria]
MMESSFCDMLMKVAMFILIQALVYLILSNSSNVFSKTIKRSHSFKRARSLSIRRILAVLSELPPEAEQSPCSASSKSHQSPIHEKSS